MGVGTYPPLQYIFTMFNDHRTIYLKDDKLPTEEEILSSNIFHNLLKSLSNDIQIEFKNNGLKDSKNLKERIFSPDAGYPTKPLLTEKIVSRSINYPTWCLLGGRKKAEKIKNNNFIKAHEEMIAEYTAHLSKFYIELLTWKVEWENEHQRLIKKNKENKIKIFEKNNKIMKNIFMIYSKEILLLKNRYPFIIFKFDDLDLIYREFSYLEEIGRSNGNYLGYIFLKLAEYCFLNFSSNWYKIFPITTSAIKPKNYIENDLPDNWSDLRKTCFKRDTGKCQRCGVQLNQKYQIHHLTARSLGGDNHLTNLATLCIDCHSLQGGNHSKIICEKYDIIDFIDKINPNISVSFNEMHEPGRVGTAVSCPPPTMQP